MALTIIQALPYPHMTTAQRNALVGVIIGFTIYNTDTSTIERWNGVVWTSEGLLPFLKVGNISGGNYSEFLADGTLRYRGDSTVWKDMVSSLFGKRLFSTSGKVNYDYQENTLIFSPSGLITDENDRVSGNQEINHEFKVGVNILMLAHVHWWQQVTINTIKPIVFTLRYRLQRNGFAKETAWIPLTANAGADDVYDFTAQPDGLYNQITKFTPFFITCGLSDTIQFQMCRTDAQTGNISATFFDIHALVDSDGSDTEFNKTP